MKQQSVLIVLCSCTTLGPMPATTGISATPMGRPGLVAQAGPVPGFYASSSAAGNSRGAPLMHGSLLLDLDRWVAKGLVFGARMFGQEGDAPSEGFIGYRKRVDDDIALAGIAFGSSGRATKSGASYHGVRVGGEAMADARLFSTGWLALHGQAAVSVTRILMSGTYCVGASGVAVDCQDDGSKNTMVSGRDVGVYPAATASLALDLGAHRSAIDSLRLALMGAVGSMPIITGGEKTATEPYVSLGLTLSLALGLDETE